MSSVQASDLHITLGGREILKGVSLTLSPGKKIALTGSNGSGKSTLMKIIAGWESPDAGSLHGAKGCRIAYLPQSGLVYRGRTLKEEVETAYDFFHGLLAEKNRVEEALGRMGPGDSGLENLTARQHHLEELLLDSGYWRRDEVIETVLKGLGFNAADLGRRVEEFSGGWQMRIALAKVLLAAPDVFLLDEPTNYLDLETRAWLLQFLADCRGALLLVSHDRYFLDETVKEVAELFNGRLTFYKGNYSGYLARRERELAELIKKYREQEAEIERVEAFIAKFRYKATKAAMVQSRIKQLEKMDRIEIPESLKKIHFHFPPAPPSGNQVLTIEGLTKSYGSLKVIDNLSLNLTKGQKLVVAGKNGAGKSTLMRLISGHDQDYTGTIKPGSHVQTGYFAQDQEAALDPRRTVAEEAEAAAPSSLFPQLRNMLGAFLFRGDDINKAVAVLSGGERSRLALLKLLLRPANLLILDEPTNHLDMFSKDILLEALAAYQGTLVFVSHDRYFIEKLATSVLELSPRGARLFSGDYSYYLWKTAGEELPPAAPSSSPAAGKTAPPPPRQIPPVLPAAEKALSGKASAAPSGTAGKAILIPHPARREEYRRRKALLQRAERREQELLQEIAALTARQKELEAELARPEVYSLREKAGLVQAQLQGAAARQEELSRLWEEAALELENLQKAD
jgi:ATP-binding cassette subfamily F protein 3